jgi:hypothetical protein
MGWFDGTSIVSDRPEDRDRSSNRKHEKHSSSGRGIFGLGGDDYHHHNASRSSFFSFGKLPISSLKAPMGSR